MTKVLVVDDDTDTCMSVSKMLRTIGMRADWTVSGKESIVRAKEAFDEGMILLSKAFLLFLFRIFVPDIRILHVFFSGSLILKREF